MYLFWDFLDLLGDLLGVLSFDGDYEDFFDCPLDCFFLVEEEPQQKILAQQLEVFGLLSDFS
jgi:hypothetical protein